GDKESAPHGCAMIIQDLAQCLRPNSPKTILKIRPMRTIKRLAILGALAPAIVLAGQGEPGARAYAQEPASIALTVEDASGAALAGARVADSAGHLLGITDANGDLTVSCAQPCALTISADGFATQNEMVSTDTGAIRLKP